MLATKSNLKAIDEQTTHSIDEHLVQALYLPPPSKLPSIVPPCKLWEKYFLDIRSGPIINKINVQCHNIDNHGLQTGSRQVES